MSDEPAPDSSPDTERVDVEVKHTSSRPPMLHGGGLDQASAYVAPTPLPRRQRTNTLDMVKVRIAETVKVNARNAPTLRSIKADRAGSPSQPPLADDPNAAPETPRTSGEPRERKSEPRIHPAPVLPAGVAISEPRSDRDARGASTTQDPPRSSSASIWVLASIAAAGALALAVMLKPWAGATSRPAAQPNVLPVTDTPRATPAPTHNDSPPPLATLAPDPAPVETVAAAAPSSEPVAAKPAEPPQATAAAKPSVDPKPSAEPKPPVSVATSDATPPATAATTAQPKPKPPPKPTSPMDDPYGP